MIRSEVQVLRKSDHRITARFGPYTSVFQAESVAEMTRNQIDQEFFFVAVSEL